MSFRPAAASSAESLEYFVARHYQAAGSTVLQSFFDNSPALDSFVSAMLEEVYLKLGGTVEGLAERYPLVPLNQVRLDFLCESAINTFFGIVAHAGELFGLAANSADYIHYFSCKLLYICIPIKITYS